MNRILLIDDTEAFQRLIQINLYARGYTVLSASDGVSGLEMARRDEPDLIILDLMLPDIPGWEILKCFKDDVQLTRIPVFVMTASEGIDDEKTAASMGAAGYFSKPLILRCLLSKIKELMELQDPE